MKTYKGLILKRSDIPDNGIFVFGSNTEGRHGKGAALIALQEFEANYGQASGPQERSYAIMTKNLKAKFHPSISKEDIKFHIFLLYEWAKDHPENDYYIAYTLHPNLNGYSPQEMADMFSAWPIPDNIVFEEEFAKLLKSKP